MSNSVSFGLLITGRRELETHLVNQEVWLSKASVVRIFSVAFVKLTEPGVSLLLNLWNVVKRLKPALPQWRQFTFGLVRHEIGKHQFSRTLHVLSVLNEILGGCHLFLRHLLYSSRCHR